MENVFTQTWIKRSLFSLLLLTLLNLLLRYQVAFGITWLQPGYLQSAYSHFALAGWLTQIIMVLLLQYLSREHTGLRLSKYNGILWANLVTAWIMLAAFWGNGMGLPGIVATGAWMVVGIAFAIKYWRDLAQLPAKPISQLWAGAALLWFCISALGLLALGYRMTAGEITAEFTKTTTDFLLHFQYNGWAFFGAAALLYSSNEGRGSAMKYIFWLFALACGPAVLLLDGGSFASGNASVWASLAALMQLVGWGALLLQAHRRRLFSVWRAGGIAKGLLWTAALAGTLKMVAQAALLDPQIAKWSATSIPLQEAYLQNMVLALLTFFLLGYCAHLGFIPAGKNRHTGLAIFAAGAAAQVVILAVQAGMEKNGGTFSQAPAALLIASGIAALGTLILALGMWDARRQAPEAAPLPVEEIAH